MATEPQLMESAVSAETAQKAGVYRLSSADARTLGLLAANTANLSGLAFPYRHPVTGQVLVTRIRPDNAVNGCKYLAPIGSRNHLYLPFATEALLTDARFAVVLTEGEKKTLALAEAAGSKYLAVGISGVWNWRTSDKEKRPLADRPGSRTVKTNSRPIEDLDWITWRNRQVFVILDSDGATNPDVLRAETALCGELRRRGATPLVVSLPPSKDGSKQGIDDFLARHEASTRLAALDRLLRAATPRRRVTTAEERPLDLLWDPPGGFLRTFDGFADEQTDAPAAYRAVKDDRDRLDPRMVGRHGETSLPPWNLHPVSRDR
jgi:hypothetical protein